MSVLASIRSQLAPIHREGLPFIGVFAVVSLLLFWLWPPLGWLGALATLWCVYFFRDPARVTPRPRRDRGGSRRRAGEPHRQRGAAERA